MRLLLTTDDFSDEEVKQVLRRADDFANGATPTVEPEPLLLGLVFFEPSLRTRLGFAAAAARLGWHWIEVTESRVTSDEFAESWEDTLRVASGYCDMLVARPRQPLTARLSPALACSLVNGGDTGPAAQHPTQALIDLFAMERLRGPIEGSTVAIVGDVRMRAVRSLLSLLARRRPRHTVVVTNPTYLEDSVLDALPWITADADLSAARGADVVYVAGMPHGSIAVSDRRSLIIGEPFVRKLAEDAVILSPMPVLDEIDEVARRDPRIRFYDQSDLGRYVRMAVLELVRDAL